MEKKNNKAPKEATARAENVAPGSPTDNYNVEYLTPEDYASERDIWINPLGGLGDVLMLSTVLKLAHDQYGRQFKMARRSQYTQFFDHHPAVSEIGHPPVDAFIIGNDYWSRREYQDPANKSLSILKKIFAVEDNGDDSLYLQPMPKDKRSEIQLNTIPWDPNGKNVVICTSSASPRKMMEPMKWHIIVDKLRQQQVRVLQVGNREDMHIIGTYSLLGCTTPWQLIEIIRKASLVITPDNFVMHAAKAVGTPAIALFGPTEAAHYAYNGHVAMQADKRECPEVDKCLGPHVAENYATQCPLREKHCMNSFDVSRIIDIALSLI